MDTLWHIGTGKTISTLSNYSPLRHPGNKKGTGYLGLSPPRLTQQPSHIRLNSFASIIPRVALQIKKPPTKTVMTTGSQLLHR